VLAAITNLTSAGYGLLLQIHDFAEDFRPDNYRQLAALFGGNEFEQMSAALYPQASQVHYAVLNGRDKSILRHALQDDSCLHLLPNAVADIGPLPPRDEARAKLADRFGISLNHRFVLYPVRGIRRKNLGEALLWSVLANRETSFGLTLPPLNPIEQPSYLGWKELAASLGLPWVFEVGAPGGLAYGENLAAADAILTTSVAEGFGLVFLEAWLTGNPLIGRDLPEITADFVGAGLRFPGLGASLRIPIEWLKEQDLLAEIAVAYQQVLAAYGRTLPSLDDLRQGLDELIQNNLVDFAVCGTATQRQVIEQVAGDASRRDRLLRINPCVRDALDARDIDVALIRRNAEIVRESYSLAQSGNRLLDIYHRVAASPRDSEPKAVVAAAGRILERFLRLSRFHPLRVES
jgi:hypothetical protein